MRRKGSVACFKRDRDRELLRIFREKLSQCKGYIFLPDVLEATVNSPTSHFWVSSERAITMIHRIRKGSSLDNMRETRREMFFEIERRVMELEKKGLSLEDAVLRTLDGGAPKFYITSKSAKILIHKIKKSWKKGLLVI